MPDLHPDPLAFRSAMRAPSAEFERGGDPADTTCAACNPLEAHACSVISGHELADIVNTAIQVGRGTETLKNLAAMLEPYGVRRKR